MKEKVDLHAFSEISKENSSPTRRIYLAPIKAEKSGHGKSLRISKNGNVKDLSLIHFLIQTQLIGF